MQVHKWNGLLSYYFGLEVELGAGPLGHDFIAFFITTVVLDMASFKLDNFKMVKDEIEEIFLEIDNKITQLKKVIWVETDRKEEERCLHYDYD